MCKVRHILSVISERVAELTWTCPERSIQLIKRPPHFAMWESNVFGIIGNEWISRVDHSWPSYTNSRHALETYR